MKPNYSEVMEDFWVIDRSLRIRPGDTVATVASAGDNAFNSVVAGAGRVIAVDNSAPQITVSRVKHQILTELPHETAEMALGFVASTPDADATIRKLIAGTGLDYDIDAALAAGGVNVFSHLEDFLDVLRTELGAMAGDALAALVSAADPDVRLQLWDEQIAGSGVAQVLSEVLHENKISGAFIPPDAFPRMAHIPFSDFFLRLMFRQLVVRDPRENYYFPRLITGRHATNAPRPLYARPENSAVLAQRRDVIDWHVADFGSVVATETPGSVDAFNLSNILDWSDVDQYEFIWRAVDSAAAPGARLFLRSFLSDRPLPDAVVGRWRLDHATSADNALVDRIGYYSRYELWTLR
ncbi:BtaA family protein [Rhodococcus rhodochrous]|nr:BtaA family protein [Rhodococcus rhodochrous]